MKTARHLWNLCLLGRWSPLARMPDLLTVAVLLNAYTAWAFRDPADRISKASIYAKLSGNEQTAAAAASLAVCCAAYFFPFSGGWAATILGLGLRAFDAYQQHSPIGTYIYGIIFVIGVIRLIQRQREADLTRFVMAEARIVIREREAVDALLRRWDRPEP